MMFVKIVKSSTGLDVEKEYRFHPERKWRFDYAIPDLKIAIEIDGGVWINGRHNRASGYIKDMQKFNIAASLGWLILKFTPEEMFKITTLDIISQTIRNRENERNLERHSRI